MMVVDENDAPALSAKHLRRSQAGWPAPDDRNVEM
ncbi:hypothetical protein J2W15_003259 [Pseudarthrobacter sulfonivorans]|nr:hypothetical protein [Pseudarthrobacter sulfonivorans]